MEYPVRLQFCFNNSNNLLRESSFLMTLLMFTWNSNKSCSVLVNNSSFNVSKLQSLQLKFDANSEQEER